MGKNTLRGMFHDMDKLILCITLPKKKVSGIHRRHSRHHEKARTRTDFINMIIDWECARITKPDKPLNARKTMYKYYPHLRNEILPLLEELGL